MIREKAHAFATEKHEGQTRKNGITPYITHPIGVAKIVGMYGGDDNQVAIALLHDVLEDCDCTDQELVEAFGEDVADGVIALTNTSKIQRPDLNRAARKQMDNERLKTIDDRYKLVKLADIYYNVNDLNGLERGFALKFLQEKKNQAYVVREGNQALYENILTSIETQEDRLGR